MTVKVTVPNFKDLNNLVTERTTDIAVANIQEEAVLTAPVDTGAYRRNIVADFNKDEVRAEIVYSRVVEYGFKGRRPTANMRLAGRKVQSNIANIYNKELNKLKG